MAHLRMSEVVYKSEHGVPRIGVETGGLADARTHLASQMFTDAVFSQDIRVIQTIINRIDGGLPKDIDIDEYQTLFGDCMNEVLSMTSGHQLKVMPDDTVMMALCKSLYDIATTDIYHEVKNDKHGNAWARKINPSTEKKQARDSAQRLVLERAGGRKTTPPASKQKLASVSVADWIKGALPGTGEEDEAASEA
jgi:hypothetical protein